MTCKLNCKMLDFPGGADGKASVYWCRRPGFDPWVGKIPWRRKWQPTPVLLPGKSHGRRSLEQATLHGVAKSRTRLSDFNLSSSLCGMLIFYREEWATSIDLEETLFQVHQGYHPRCLGFKFYFFPSQGPDLGESDLHELRIKISLELHLLDKYTLGLSLVLSTSGC